MKTPKEGGMKVGNIESKEVSEDNYEIFREVKALMLGDKDNAAVEGRRVIYQWHMGRRGISAVADYIEKNFDRKVSE